MPDVMPVYLLCNPSHDLVSDIFGARCSSAIGVLEVALEHVFDIVKQRSDAATRWTSRWTSTWACGGRHA
jgi:hypothetical protein